MYSLVDLHSNLPHRQERYADAMRPIHLLIIADDPLARVGLAQLLGDAPACRISAQTSLAEADDALDIAQPDAIVWDVGWNANAIWPDWSEIDLPVIALLADEADATAAWTTGANALLSRLVDGETLMAAVRTAVHGLTILDPTLAQSLLLNPALTPPLVEDLTPRELEALQLMAQGLTNKTIAQRLDISAHTVKFHVSAIMSKIGAQSRTEAVVRATQMGLISL